ncbi:MAG: transcriptional regulator, partial [Pseudomonadota bacterium]
MHARSTAVFTPPGPCWHEVRRAALLRDVLCAPPARLTLITAPAGYGKTDFGAQWHRARTADGGPAIWLSLGTEDKDPHRLLQRLARGLEHAGAGGASADLDALSLTALSASVHQRAAALPAQTVLFLDDYHLAQTDPVESVVFRLCTAPECAGLAIVLLTRGRPSFPMMKLKVAGALREIGAERLRFSLDETRALFGGAVSDPPAALVEEVHGSAEGWPVALQMARALWQEGAAPSLWRGPVTGQTEMGRYLVEQLLARLPAPLHRFLRLTAALPLVSEELAVAATGEADAARRFGQLGAHGLPIFTEDAEGLWVRYHPILRSFLQDAAAREGIEGDDTLARAARWLHRRGELAGALRHALPRTDPDLAFELMEKEGGWRVIYLTRRGGMSMFRLLLERIENVDLSRFPLTALGLAVARAKMGHLRSARLCLRRAQAGCTGSEKLERNARLVAALVALYEDTRLTTGELTALENDLASAAALDTVHHGLLLNLLCFNYLNQSRFETAIVYGEQSQTCLQDAGAQFGALHLYHHIGQARYFSGDSAGAQTAYRALVSEARAFLGAGSDLELIGTVLLCELLVQRGAQDATAPVLDWALVEAAEDDVWFDILAARLQTRLRLALAGSHFEAAHAALDAAEQVARRRGLGRLERLCAAERVRTLIAEGEAAQAVRFAQTVGLGAGQALARGANGLCKAHRLRRFALRDEGAYTLGRAQPFQPAQTAAA